MTSYVPTAFLVLAREQTVQKEIPELASFFG